MTDRAAIVTAAVLLIGDELLSGRTADANLAYIAKWLNAHGIQLQEARMVADRMADIADAVNALRERYDYVFTTGGIGPTHDDITVESIALAFGVPVIMHPEAVAILEQYYGDQITDRRLLMARTPQGATVIVNPMSGAPGIRYGNVFIMAGIPAVMRAMLEGLAGQLRAGRTVLSRSFGVAAAESRIAGVLDDVQRGHDDVMIGSYPVFRPGQSGVNLVLRSVDQARLDTAAAALSAALHGAGFAVSDQEI